MGRLEIVKCLKKRNSSSVWEAGSVIWDRGFFGEGALCVWSDGAFPYGGGPACGGCSAGVSASWPAVPQLGLLAGVAQGNWYSIAEAGGAQLTFKPQFSAIAQPTAAAANVTLSVQSDWPLPDATFTVEVRVV